jgi:hypothetical protein
VPPPGDERAGGEDRASPKLEFRRSGGIRVGERRRGARRSRS